MLDNHQLANLLNDEFEFPEVGLVDWLSVADFVLAKLNRDQGKSAERRTLGCPGG